ncbi:C4-dicarboxylate transporter/malic acid transport protein [Dissulfuribacter thermophilus]|uniref:C4-dicarboxylate transporter/malic acid transport protein n=1 Tax=Dissulfuribacter thermophilus TaxID=1156395 RepID=A0A1B9F3K1_9BACT|nr:TDT family transporter [Dissulfuribacter thermophilus]OCC14341.1 C4-dicarboxylate transporter/malic acid transport protein [Dissulfuribacter thermophilus]
MSLKPFANKELKKIIRNFTPNWFTVNMGTGISFLTLFNIRADLFPGELLLGQVIWFVDIFFFVLFSFLFIYRMILFPDTIKPMLQHPVQSMFLGAIPMALVPVLEGFAIFGPSFLGEQAINIALFLWWIDVILAVGVGWLLPYLMSTTQEKHKLENMTAVWLLPIVASEVTASAGGVLAPYFSGETAKTIIIVSYVLWTFSVPLAFSILVILFLRLATHKLPHRAMATTSWLPLGPLGTGSLGMLLLGSATKATYIGIYISQISDFLASFGFITGLLLWGYGLWWYVMAWLFTIKYFNEGLPFNMGWWGFTFPVGVFTAATFQLWRVTDYTIFEILGLIFSFQLIIFWILVFTKTLKGMWSGYLFQAPCLSKETGLPKPLEDCNKVNN